MLPSYPVVACNKSIVELEEAEADAQADDPGTTEDESADDDDTWDREGKEPETLEDLSKKYKISRERIRQIETKAFEKLQKSMINASKSKNLLTSN